MEGYALRLRKEAKFRDCINQFLANIGEECDEQWWTTSQAAAELSRLVGPAQWQVTDFLKLHMENGGNLVIAVWNGEMDKQGLEQLSKAIEERLEEVVKTRKPTFEQERNCARSKNKIFVKKLNINFLFFTKDSKSRIALEMNFASKMRNDLKRTIQKKFSVPVSFECTYIVYQEYHGELARIRGINRYNSLQMPPIGGRSNTESQGEFVEDIIQSSVVTAQLKQLVELYDQVGDQLFRYNVRFGIGEAFDVSKAIRKTLEEEPQRFWFKNNGITLLVEDPDFRLEHLDELQLGTLEPDHLPQFSVVNGAQTITISARYAFELEYLKLDKPDQKDLYEKKLKDFAKAQVILRIIHVPVQSEQTGTDDERAEIQAAKDLAQEVSVSLNRQKPILAEDIAFTTPFVQKLTEYLSNPQNDPPFQLIRRGEERAQASQLSLTDFSRARLACAGRPGKARAASRNDIFKMDLTTKAFQNTDIFVESWVSSEADERTLFQRYYGAVWFADRIAKVYTKISKLQEYENTNAQKAVQNGKWYFTALVVQLLNGFKTEDGQPDFSDFCATIQDVVEIMPQAVEVFSQMAVYCADETHQLNSNDFKNEEYFQKLLSKLKSGERDSPFEKFSKLFVPSLEGRTFPQQKFRKSKITAIALGSGRNYIPVKSAKEAFEKTVCYILEKFSPDAALLTRFGSWLTTDPQEAALSKGNFSSKSPVVLYGGQKYWIGSELLNNDRKFSSVRSLCKLADVPQQDILWLADGTICYQW